MMTILEEKIKEFPDRDKYFKKEHDMKLLTLIDKKVNNNIELTLDELKFLYEVDSKIEGFGYEKDPRINEIKNKRNIKKDCALIFDVKEEVALSQEEWEENQNKFKIFVSDLYLYGLTSADGLVLPQSVGGNLFLDNLTSAKGLVLPQSVGDNLFLDNLTSAEGLVLPQYIGGNLNLCSLTSADGLVLPQSVGGNLYLSKLTGADGLVLPQSVGGNLYLSKLTGADGLVLPQSVGGELYLGCLTSAVGIVLPQYIGGNLNLGSLTSAEGLVLPQNVGGNLDLWYLTSAEGLILPYDFDLNKLICPSYIKNEILQNPDKYFRKPPSEEENISVHHKR